MRFWIPLFLFVLFSDPVLAQPIVIGSKTFTESVILGELAAKRIQAEGYPTRHRRQLGGSPVLWNGLQNGEIDIYPEYTGTIMNELLVDEGIETLEELGEFLQANNLGMTHPLGFNNTYILGMNEDRAEELGIERISDLQQHPDLRFGFSGEFMDRQDGWPGLRVLYQLPQQNVFGMDHDLAYRGIANGDLDVIDLYSTDAEIEYYGLRTLEDDLGYFPEYLALFVYRLDLLERAPEAVEALRELEDAINPTGMVAMNASAKIDENPEGLVASRFLEKEFGISVAFQERTLTSRILRYTREHLVLVGISLGAAVLLAVPLGVLAAKVKSIGQGVLGVVSIVQTIPALAMLVFMIPPLGIGTEPALAALFLYSLLPIVRNTYAGLHDIPSSVVESANAMGLDWWARIRLIELPMAMRSILAGIKTSAVINIGTATLGALIGAGGYGQPILTGIRRDDYGLILLGAVPAAIMAICAQIVFEFLERKLIARGLRNSG